MSKVAQDYLAYQYFQSYGMKAVRTRGFNHTGPRRGEVFVTSNFARQVARIEAGLQEPVLRVGNLDAVRDFTDVRDMVRGLLAGRDQGASRARSTTSPPAAASRSAPCSISSWRSPRSRCEVETDPARLRPSDVEVLIGDSSKFRADTGWEPRIPFDADAARPARLLARAGRGPAR